MAAQRPPEQVRVHDSRNKELGKAIRRVYDVPVIKAGSAWNGHDTAEFAMETIRRCALQMGRNPIRGHATV